MGGINLINVWLTAFHVRNWNLDFTDCSRVTSKNRPVGRGGSRGFAQMIVINDFNDCRSSKVSWLSKCTHRTWAKILRDPCSYYGSASVPNGLRSSLHVTPLLKFLATGLKKLWLWSHMQFSYKAWGWEIAECQSEGPAKQTRRNPTCWCKESTDIYSSAPGHTVRGIMVVWYASKSLAILEFLWTQILHDIRMLDCTWLFQDHWTEREWGEGSSQHRAGHHIDSYKEASTQRFSFDELNAQYLNCLCAIADESTNYGVNWGEPERAPH